MKPRRPIVGGPFDAVLLQQDEPPAWMRYRPAISYYHARHAYFCYRGTFYPIETAPSNVFSAAVLEVAPHVRQALQAKDDLDMVDRWYTLCCVTNGVYPLRLYTFRERTE